MSPEGSAPAIPIIRGLAAIAPHYDALILDLWGVIHGGVEPYPGVLEALQGLRAATRPVALLSNAPRRAATVAHRLSEIGVPPDLYEVLMTSGEAAHEALRERSDPAHAALGRRYLYIGPAWDRDVVAGLDLAAADAVEEADFLLCVGLYDEADPLEDYDPMLARAAGRALPFLCVNPDLWVHRQGGVTSPCAGLLAARYAGRHGGRVIAHGKPDPAIFRRAAAALGVGPKARVLVVGDGLETDIRGARAAGFESLFVTRGIFAAELGIAPGDEPDPAALAALCARHGERPTWAIATFRW